MSTRVETSILRVGASGLELLVNDDVARKGAKFAWYVDRGMIRARFYWYGIMRLVSLPRYVLDVEDPRIPVRNVRHLNNDARDFRRENLLVTHREGYICRRQSPGRFRIRNPYEVRISYAGRRYRIYAPSEAIATEYLKHLIEAKHQALSEGLEWKRARYRLNQAVCRIEERRAREEVLLCE